MKFHRLSTFSLVLITVGSVDSIRNLPATAKFGSSLIFFFLLAGIFFLLPSALIAAQLSSTQERSEGIYEWVTLGLGKIQGFFAIWFQWVENIFWYPTILAFVAGTVGYLIAPELASSKYFLLSVILLAFWGATFLNMFGMKSSTAFSTFCATFGLIIPMMLIIALGAAWWLLGRPLQVDLTPHELIPHFGSGMWVSLTGVMLSFCGMEVATVHARDAKNPARDFPHALLISVVILIVTLVLGSLSIAVVIPQSQINLVAGIMQAFHLFFASYHCTWLLPLIALMLIVGGMGGVSNWIIAPARGLMYAARDGHLPKFCSRASRRGAPNNILIIQAVIVSIVSLAFLLLPSVNASYWLLTVLAAQLYMLMYIQMFISGIVLRRRVPAHFKGFLIPGGYIGTVITAVFGLIGCLVTFLIGFVPPQNMQIGGAFRYEALLLTGLISMVIVPIVIMSSQKKYDKMLNQKAGMAPSLNS